VRALKRLRGDRPHVALVAGLAVAADGARVVLLVAGRLGVRLIAAPGRPGVLAPREVLGRGGGLADRVPVVVVVLRLDEQKDVLVRAGRRSRTDSGIGLGLAQMISERRYQPAA
jgi:hypothetical protein